MTIEVGKDLASSLTAFMMCKNKDILYFLPVKSDSFMFVYKVIRDL